MRGGSLRGLPAFAVQGALLMAKFHIKLSEGLYKDPEFEVSCDFEADTSDKEKAEQIINETMRQLFSLKNGISYPSQKKTNA